MQHGSEEEQGWESRCKQEPLVRNPAQSTIIPYKLYLTHLVRPWANPFQLGSSDRYQRILVVVPHGPDNGRHKNSYDSHQEGDLSHCYKRQRSPTAYLCAANLKGSPGDFFHHAMAVPPNVRMGTRRIGGGLSTQLLVSDSRVDAKHPAGPALFPEHVICAFSVNQSGHV
jgi:hypothetical protein